MSKCQHRTATHHSGDIVTVHLGHPFPVILCGFHAEALNIGTLPASVLDIAKHEYEEKH